MSGFGGSEPELVVLHLVVDYDPKAKCGGHEFSNGGWGLYRGIGGRDVLALGLTGLAPKRTYRFWSRSTVQATGRRWIG